MPSILSVRLDPATSQALTAAATVAETSISGFVRAAIMKALPEARTLPALPPSPPRRHVIVPDADVAIVANLAGEVARMTGATIQFAKTLREGGRAAEHESAESVLRGHRATQAALVAMIDRLKAAEVTA
jgi:hypothetical protein